tara:strand:+ start:331 stop:543 length:213 start_codon:yes stop_codon:yes gene_type:complete
MIAKRYMNIKGIMMRKFAEKKISISKNKIANSKYKENFINDRKKGKIVAQIIVVKKILISDTNSSIIPEV